MKKMIANLSSREKRVAILEDGVLSKLEIMPPHQSSLVGNVYVGRVTKVLNGMDAVFVDYGRDKNGFLHRDDIPAFQMAKREGKKAIGHYIREGEKLLVQVTRDETGTKGAKLTGLIEFSTDSLVYIHGIDYVGVSKKFKDDKVQKRWRERALEHKAEDEGLIIRTSMEEEPEEVFLSRLSSLRDTYRECRKKAEAIKAPALLVQKNRILERIEEEMSLTASGELFIDDVEASRNMKNWVQENHSSWEVVYEPGPNNIFSIHQIEEQLAKTLKKIVWLSSGGYLIFEETEAFTVIDVNSGKFTGKAGKEATLFTVNQEAAMEAARQIRLRNISGIILIDFINMEKSRHKQDIIELFKAESSRDEQRIQVVGFTELGILQVTRKRGAPSLAETMTVPCPVCSGSGAVDSPETVAFRLERELFEHRRTDDEAVWIEAAPSVVTVLLGEQEAYRETLEKLLGKTLFFTDLEVSIPQYSIRRFGSRKEIMQAIIG